MLNKKGKSVNAQYLGQIYWVDGTAGENSGRPQEGKITYTSDDLEDLTNRINAQVKRLQVKAITVEDVSFYSKI
jgi:hypothetical protein